jgi:hypothetical protein
MVCGMKRKNEEESRMREENNQKKIDEKRCRR